MSDRLRWGIIGPGEIAKAFTKGLAHSRTGRLVAIGTRDASRPGLAETFPGARIHSSYEALLADPEIEAVYIATPHPSHPEWTIKAAAAGKHVLVEKPMALTSAEAETMFDAAETAGVFLGEAFMYRLHPLAAKLGELVRSGAIGEVMMIQSSFGYRMDEVDPGHRIFANDLAGGGILDVGGYPVSMARFVAGAASGKPFLDPFAVTGAAHLGQTDVDEWAAATLTFENGIVAQVSCAIRAELDNVLRIFGSTGRIEVRDFWFAGGDRDFGPAEIDIVRLHGSRQTVTPQTVGHLYAFEADAAADAIRAGRHEFASPGMDRADSLGNLRTLDQWRAAIGLTYEIEKANVPGRWRWEAQ